MNIRTSQDKKNDPIMGILLCILLLANLVILLSLALEIVLLERICSYVILIVSFCIYIYSYILNRSIFRQDIVFFLIFIYLFILACVYSWSFDDFKVAFVFLSMLTTWRGARFIVCNQRIERMLLYVFLLQGLILIVLYFTPLAYKSYQEYVSVSSQLTLGFSNPNQTGIIIFSTLVILLILSRRCSVAKGFKCVVWVQIIALSVLLLLTDARTSIFGYAIFLLFFIFVKKRRSISPLISNVIICFPIAFVYIYEELSKSSLQDLVVFGKKLFSGRQKLFEEVLSMYDNKLFGNLTIFGFQNSHNALLTIMVNIGILGLILYLVFTILSFKSLNCRSKSNDSFINGIAILTLFIMGCTESSVLTGGTIYYVFMLVILILANSNSERIEARLKQTILSSPVERNKNIDCGSKNSIKIL